MVVAGPLTSQAIGMLLRNRLYAGIVHVSEYGVRAKRGDFEPPSQRTCPTARRPWCRVPKDDYATARAPGFPFPCSNAATRW